MIIYLIFIFFSYLLCLFSYVSDIYMYIFIFIIIILLLRVVARYYNLFIFNFFPYLLCLL